MSKEIEVSVLEEAYEFYLAFKKGWAKQVGHLIKVDSLQFSAVPIKNIIRVSEVESGANFFDIPIPDNVESYEQTMLYLDIVVAPKIVMTIEKVGIEKVKNSIEQMKENATMKLGKKPKTKKYDANWIKADISEQLN